MSNDLIEKRDERTKRRKIVKRKMDSIIGLSYHDKDKKVVSLSVDAKALSADKARLLDEGYIDNGFVLKKGALEKYLNGKNQYVKGWEFNGEEWVQTEVLNLNPDFVGTVNLGHMEFSVMPFILGEWRQSDLTLVETENDRHALDVQLHLDEDSVFVKELRRQPHDIGVSAEFWVHENAEDTKALSETLGYYLPVYDEIFIFAYGLVGECGNVNSSGLELSKEKTMPNMGNDISLVDIEVIEEPSELSAEDEIEVTPTDESEEPIEETAEEIEDSEEVAEEEEVAEADDEEADAEEADEDDLESDEGEGEEVDSLEEALSIIRSLHERIEELSNTITELTSDKETLTAQYGELKKSNRKLQSKLKSERDKKDEFLALAKDIAVELLPNEGKKKDLEKERTADYNYYYGGGIGEL